jgi:dolichyl-phosphate-mannose-protein mannosyltransferase
VLCLGLILGSSTAVRWRRALGSSVVGVYVVAIVVLFFYFYPIMTAQVIPYSDWFHHMWYHIGVGWI